MADELAEGFYYTTKLMQNPKPDRRSKRYDSVVAWAEGERVYVKPPRDGMVGQIEWKDGTTIYYGRVNADPIYGQGNEVVQNLRPADPTLGQLVKRGYATPAQLLAYFLDTHELSLNDIRRAEKVIGADEYDIAALEKKHEI